MSVELQRRLFTADEYEALARAGILDEDDRVELIEGAIVEMTPIGRRHAACVARLTRVFSECCESRGIVWVQNPIRLSDRSEPRPDLALLRSKEDFYAAGHPGPDDVFLLVEVADTSLETDREIKLPLYARSGIREAWLVDLTEPAVEVCRSPSPEGYGDVERMGPDGVLRPRGLPGVHLPVDEVIG